MKLTNKILSILKEDKEEENLFNPKDSEEKSLFKPRRVEDRINQNDPKSRRYMRLSNNQIIDVLIWNYNTFVKGKLNGAPDPDYENPGNWSIRVYLDIPEEIVKSGDGYGIYLANFLNFNEEKNCWVAYIDPSPKHNYSWIKLKGIKEAE